MTKVQQRAGKMNKYERGDTTKRIKIWSPTRM